MQKRCLSLCLAALSVASLYAEETTSYRGPKESLHIYLLIGQSNMAGRAPFSKEESKAIKGCYLLNADGSFEPAKNPLNLYSTIRKKEKMQKMNPGYGFSQEMLRNNENISVGLVVNAKGGTRIEQWAKGTEFYEEALKRTREAQKFGTLKGILWHQGEGNSSFSDTYLALLKQLIFDLREDLAEPDLPFVAGQVFYDSEKKPHTLAINEEIAKLPDAVANTEYVSSEGLTTYDKTHFDAEGMKELGKRYAEAMIDLRREE